MDPDRFVAYGLGILGLISTAFGIYWTTRKNAADVKAEEQKQKANEHDRQIDQLYTMIDKQTAMMEDRRESHEKDIEELKQRHSDDVSFLKAGQEACLQRELVSAALSTRQDNEIISLTGKVKNLTESLLAAGIDRRGREATNS